MTEIAIIDWFGRLGTSVFSENTAIFSPARLVQSSCIIMIIFTTETSTSDGISLGTDLFL